MLVKADAKEPQTGWTELGMRLYCLDYEWVFDFPVPAHLYSTAIWLILRNTEDCFNTPDWRFLKAHTISRQTAAL